MEVLKLKDSKEYHYLESLKGKAIEDWNWQIKESSSKSLSKNEDSSSLGFVYENEKNFEELEKELELIDLDI